MSRLIPAAERTVRARELIQQARDLAAASKNVRNDLSTIAQVKDLLRQARDLVKFIPQYPSATAEMKEEVSKIFQEAEQVDWEFLH